ncbi:MAG: DUF5671 domain-containing protein [Dehalococcoidia bacterium]
MSNTRRLYFYGVAFIALIVGTSGTASLLGILMRIATGTPLVEPGRALQEQVSTALAMLVVGWPLWAIHWLRVQRYTQRWPQEREAVVRKLYLYAVLGVGAGAVFLNTFTLLAKFLGGLIDGIPHLAWVAVWGALWAYHWTVEGREGQPSEGGRTLRRWYVYLTSAYSLGALGGGVGFILGSLLSWWYDALLAMPYLYRALPLWSAGMQSAVALALAGGVWWAFHWLVVARGDSGSILRQVYLYLFTFLGGAITTVATTALLLHTVLAWALGAPTVPTVQHFRLVPQALPALLVGVGILAYHWGVVQGEAAGLVGRLGGARRAFGYIMAALGLGTLVGGLAILLGMVLGLGVPGERAPLVGRPPWRGLLAAALTLLAVGGPMWAWNWWRMQGRALQEGGEERTALARRIFLYGVLAVLALLTLGSAVAFLTSLLREILAGQVSWKVIAAGRWPLGLGLAALAFLPYYWQVLLEDQRAGAEGALRRKTITLVIGEKGKDFQAQLEQALGVRLQVVWVINGEEGPPSPTPETLAPLLGQIRATPTQRVLVIATGGTLRVYGCR